jgi:hypothetical protein
MTLTGDPLIKGSQIVSPLPAVIDPGQSADAPSPDMMLAIGTVGLSAVERSGVDEAGVAVSGSGVSEAGSTASGTAGGRTLMCSL